VREERDVPLAPLTTLGLGGPADLVLTAEDEDEVVAAVRRADAGGRPVLVLGGGSNVVVPDAGFRGTVVRVAARGVTRTGERVRASAGEDWDELVARTVAEGLAGIEPLSGVPGLVGATPVQNVGAYGTDVSHTTIEVRAYDRRTGDVVDLPAAACAFGYRSSAFKRDPGRWVVLAVTYGLAEDALSAPVRYAELARAVDVEVGGRAPLAQVRDAVLALRRRKGMVVDPADPDSRSAGSFFTNPVLDAAQAVALRARAGDLEVPTWPEPGGAVKVSAAWLIERSGFAKGHGDGPAGLSGKHTLALVNRGGARTVDLLAVAREVRDGVRTAFGVELVPEPVLVGGLSL
jgi:UDP-N-acetylmuramate dehydrogenase